METTSQCVGIIGLGLLGTALSHRLLDHGDKVFGYDLNVSQMEAFDHAGGISLSNSSEIFRKTDFIILSLPTSKIADNVIKEVTDSCRPGQIVFDTTTGEPEEVVEISRKLKRRGVNYIEATVGGSSSLMRSGEAALFLGGDDNILSSSHVETLVRKLSPTVFHLGEVGNASRFKLVHNLILGLNRAVLSEGLSFAKSLGLDLSETLSILQETGAASKVMETKGEKMVTGDFTPQARLSQHLKDVRIIEMLAKQSGTPVPFSELHRQLLEYAEKLDLGTSDNSAVFIAIQNWKKSL